MPEETYECSREECEREFNSRRAMKIHRTKIHDKQSSGKISKVCEVCGDEFEIYPCRRDAARFCSEKCKGKWMSKNRTGEDNPSWSGGKDTITCKGCGDEFTVLPYRSDEAVYCSMQCRRNRFEKKCKNCGEDYEKPQSREGFSAFCSNACKYEWMSENLTGEENPSWKGGGVTTECSCCGAKIDRERWKVRHREHLFCNRDCHIEWMSKNWTGEGHPRWCGGHDYYGPNWRKKRRQALGRDDHTCQSCGATEEELGQEPDVHHIKPFREFVDEDGEVDYEAANELDNLVCLCRSCHQEYEGIPVAPENR